MKAINIKWFGTKDPSLPSEVTLPEKVSGQYAVSWMEEQYHFTPYDYELVPDASVQEIHMPDGTFPTFGQSWHCYRLKSLAEAKEICQMLYETAWDEDMTAALGDAEYPCTALFWGDTLCNGKCEGTLDAFLENIQRGIREIRKNVPEETNREYIAVGIYERGDAITASCLEEIFLPDCTTDLAFIRAIHGEPVKMDMGMSAYGRHAADFDVFSTNDVKAWQICHKHGWLDWTRAYGGCTPLQWALRQYNIRNNEVFDYLRDKEPDTDLSDILWYVKNLEAAKWALANGADPNYAGFSNPLEELMRWNRYPESDAIYELCYGKPRPKTT